MYEILPLPASSVDELMQMEYLTSDHVEKFHEILRSGGVFDPQNVLLMQNMYNHIIPKLGPHIQILMTENTNRVGHWICTYYNGGAIHVYDSANINRDMHITNNQLRYLQHLYPYQPFPQLIYEHVQQQDNGVDCGVFAIAYATTLALGEDPIQQVYSTTEMRSHLRNIFETRKLSLFPAKKRRGRAKKGITFSLGNNNVLEVTGISNF